MSGALPSAGPARSPRRMRPRGRANEASRSWGGDPRAQWDPTARYDPTAQRGRGKAAGPSPSAHAEVLTRPFPVSQRISHLSYRPLAPVRVTDPSSSAPAGHHQPRAGHHDPARCVPGGPGPRQPRDANRNPGAAAGSPASPASCLSPALAAPSLAFGFAPRKAQRASELCLGTARSHRGPACHRGPLHCH